jgi:hypothetical protein
VPVEKEWSSRRKLFQFEACGIVEVWRVFRKAEERREQRTRDEDICGCVPRAQTLDGRFGGR